MLPKLLVLLYLSTYYYKGFFLKKGKIFYLRKARFVIMSSAVHISYNYEKEFCFAFQHYSPTVAAAAYFSFFNLLCQVALHHHSPFLMLQLFLCPVLTSFFPPGRFFIQIASENKYKAKLLMYWIHLKCGVYERPRNTFPR